jgi:hypothetical protein
VQWEGFAGRSGQREAGGAGDLRREFIAQRNIRNFHFLSSLAFDGLQFLIYRFARFYALSGLFPLFEHPDSLNVPIVRVVA